MSYSTNPKVVDRVRSHLELLLTAEEDSVFFESNNPSKLAYNIRQAMFASKFHDEFSQYVNLKEHWKVHVGTRGIECRRKIDQRETEPSKQVGAVTLKEITVLTGVLGAALRFKQAEELIFPNVNLSSEDKMKLFNWTATQDWGYIDHMGEGITLTKREEDFDLYWNPEDES